MIFLKTDEFDHMDLNLRDKYILCEEGCTKLFARLPNVFKVQERNDKEAMPYWIESPPRMW